MPHNSESAHCPCPTCRTHRRTVLALAALAASGGGKP